MSKILNFGSCNIDCVYGVDHITAPGETGKALTFERFPGGKGLNQSIALARAGAQVFHAGCIGEDGGFLRTLLEDNGVDTRYLRTVTQPTGCAIIQVERGGENSILLFGGANMCVGRDFVDEVLADFGAGDYCLLQNEISNVGYIAEAAARKGMRLVLNPSPCDETVTSIDLSTVSCLLLNELEACAFTGTENAADFLDLVRERYPGLHAVLTLGKRGSIYQYGDMRLEQPACRVRTVDTTGAGDTFTGYFVGGMVAGENMRGVLARAAAAAAIAVTREGAACAIPDKAEVERRLDEMHSSDN